MHLFGKTQPMSMVTWLGKSYMYWVLSPICPLGWSFLVQYTTYSTIHGHDSTKIAPALHPEKAASPGQPKQNSPGIRSTRLPPSFHVHPLYTTWIPGSGLGTVVDTKQGRQEVAPEELVTCNESDSGTLRWPRSAGGSGAVRIGQGWQGNKIGSEAAWMTGTRCLRG